MLFTKKIIITEQILLKHHTRVHFQSLRYKYCNKLNLLINQMHPGFGLWLQGHVYKAIWQLVYEINTHQIDRELSQRENLKANFIVECENGFEESRFFVGFFFPAIIFISFHYSLQLTRIFSRKVGSSEIEVAGFFNRWPALKCHCLSKCSRCWKWGQPILMKLAPEVAWP